ncbi:MAG: OmpH family outer membrane protein [Planctomycetia bacterium]|nr:OmpH family outer membrane protein [Planctomycetia bacterium]
MYRKIMKSKVIPVLIMALGLGCGSMLAMIGRPVSAAAPVHASRLKIAVVDLGKLTQQLTEQAADQQIMQSRLNQFKQEVAKRKKVIQKLEEPLNPQSVIALKPNTPEYKAQANKLLKASLKLQVFEQFTQDRLKIKQRMLTADIYRDVNDAVAQYAKTHGIDLVLVTHKFDYNVTSTRNLMLQIANRAVLYHDGAVDITDPLVRIMNQAYQKAHPQ